MRGRINGFKIYKQKKNEGIGVAMITDFIASGYIGDFEGIIPGIVLQFAKGKEKLNYDKNYRYWFLNTDTIFTFKNELKKIVNFLVKKSDKKGEDFKVNFNNPKKGKYLMFIPTDDRKYVNIIFTYNPENNPENGEKVKISIGLSAEEFLTFYEIIQNYVNNIFIIMTNIYYKLDILNNNYNKTSSNSNKNSNSKKNNEIDISEEEIDIDTIDEEIGDDIELDISEDDLI